ncbi:MAG: GNAT family N-acetyltransferase [Lachnospiraceae bacterium]|nr:GNAT family N-acetyltransferase [Lachnospiraceae bacterium]
MLYKATTNNCNLLATLAINMWKNHTIEELEDEFRNIIQNKDSAIFLLKEDEQNIGFAQCQLRYDYVEGTNSSPVGYLEGIYVKDAYRGQGYAKQLLSECERWARKQGCKQFASDCELYNETSLAFHLKVGFTEANRIICFTKEL